MSAILQRTDSGTTKIGAFIVPGNINTQNSDGACNICFHPSSQPSVNTWGERGKYIAMFPESLSDKEHEEMTVALNDAIAHAMGTTRFCTTWRERSWFIGGKDFATLAEFSFRSGKEIVDPQSYFNQI